MTWVRDSDDVQRDEALREAGPAAALLWFVAMRECAAKDGDGVMSPLMVKDAAGLFDIKLGPALRALVEQGKWHDEDGLATCAPCRERTPSLPSPRHVVIHEWWEHLLSSAGKTDEVKRYRERRRKALNSPRCAPIRQAVRERDRDLCRFCGVATTDSSGPDKRSATVRTLDHLDPWGENSVENVVVACKRCNGRKNERTPEDAGMVLLEPGTTRADLAASRNRPETAGSDPAQIEPNPALEPATDPAHARAAREAGAGQVGPGLTGPGSGSEPDRVPAHTTNGHGSNGVQP